MAHTLFVGTLEHPYINPLEFNGWVWSQNNVYQDPVYINYFLANDYYEWTPREATAYVTALQSWANVANIRIGAAESAAGSDLIAHNVAGDFWDSPVYGEHGTPWNASHTDPQYSGDVLLSTHDFAHGYFNWEGFGWDYDDPNGGLNVGGNGYWTLIHELGHGLGLSHPFDNGGGGGLFPGVPAGSDGYDRGDNGLNQGVWTVMSYTATQSTASANSSGRGNDTWTMGGVEVANYGYYAGPMAFDIAAIQDLYGANTNFHNGFDTYNLPDQNQVGTYFTCIWDTGGTDSISYGGARNVTISLRAATLDNSATGGGIISSAQGIQGGYTIANGVVIENAYAGGGNDTIEGNQVANILNGGGGADRMTGWGGNDSYWVDNVGDVVVEEANRGTADRVNVTLTTYTIPYQVEEVNYIGPSTANVRLTGNQLNNVLLAWGGNDTLDGGSGADRMVGYSGNDTYWVETVGDTVEEWADGGTDTVLTTLSTYSLQVNVEVLDYRGVSTANFRGVGNGSNNTIIGWSGNDDLDGLQGADRMIGYGGSDTYWVDDVGDVVVESSTGGSDWVNTTLATYTLEANVEGVQSYFLDGAAFHGTGNELDNDILSYDGDDVLDGKGGADDLIGNGGNDTYYVDNLGDTVFDTFGQGDVDRIFASSSYVLTSNDEIEFISTTSAAATTAINLTGNGIGQTITGNNGANTLSGREGADTLIGNGGSDFLDGGAGADSLIGGEGYDSADYSTSAGVVVSLDGSLVKTGDAVGDTFSGIEALRGSLNGADRLRGDAGHNLLEGRGGNDVLEGQDGNDHLAGGKGADTLIGGDGQDEADYRSSGGVDVALNGSLAATGFAVGDVFVGIEGLLGSMVGADHLRGSAGNDRLEGNGGNDRLEGGRGNDWLVGGAGTDTLDGGAGEDTFLFNGKLWGSGIDRILYYSVAEDTIRLSKAVFAGIAQTGDLVATSAFRSGTGAVDATDRIIYNSATGALFYDADGLGGAAQIQFAQLSAGLALSNADFAMVG